MCYKTFSAFLVILCISCSTYNTPISVSYEGYRIEKNNESDTAVLNLVKPYAAEVNKIMNKVIGFATTAMYKKQPESVLGNFMADCMQQMSSKKYGRPVDIGFMNQGGIRSAINKGNITVGNIYELMPFDNLVVLQEMSGAVLEKFIQHIAADGGWPISAGSSFIIKDKKAINIIINGKPLDINTSYLTANTDYVANGGSNASMLKKIPQQNKGYLMRDALIDYITDLTAKGRPIDGKIENRVTKANE